MRVAVAGSGTVVGRCALRGLHAAGHEVVVVDTGAEPLPDVAVAARTMAGCDALVSLPAQIPTGRQALRGRAWRTHDLRRSEGVLRLTEAARLAGVRRVVLQSVSFVYADGADDWITEHSPVCVTAATEPASVGELAVQRHTGAARTGVVLRMGLVVGDSPLTRWSLRAAAAGRPVGLGDPDGYAHLIHSDDVGDAVCAALDAPSGTYNVGAEPVRRGELADRCAAAVGRDEAGFLGAWTTRWGRERLEPLRRSLRVSSDRFSDVTGWRPRRERLDAGWFEAAGLPELVVR